MKLVFDIGGTNFRMALSRNGRTFERPLLVPVPKNYQAAIKLLVTTGKKLAGGKRITAIAGGIAGPLDNKKSTLAASTHLRQFVRRPIAADLRKEFRSQVFLENDSAMVALGEASVGSGKGYSIVGYIGIGTGIGGARIVDGAIDKNQFGFEPGHHFLKYDVRHHQHPSRHPGDWESLVSGSGIESRFGKSSRLIVDRRVWEEMAYLTSLGLINVMMFWSPQVLVVGGSLMKRIPIGLVRSEFRRHQKIVVGGPKIVRGTLGDFGGLYGALAHIRSLEKK